MDLYETFNDQQYFLSRVNHPLPFQKLDFDSCLILQEVCECLRYGLWVSCICNTLCVSSFLTKIYCLALKCFRRTSVLELLREKILLLQGLAYMGYSLSNLNEHSLRDCEWSFKTLGLLQIMGLLYSVDTVNDTCVTLPFPSSLCAFGNIKWIGRRYADYYCLKVF